MRCSPSSAVVGCPISMVRLRASQGFTMLEMMVVVFVLTILAAIAIPSFRELIANNRVSSAASELQALLLYARAEAVYRHMPVTVQMLEQGKAWEVHSKAHLLRTAQISDAVVAAPTGHNTLDFTARGKATPAPYAVRVSAAAATRQQCVRVTAAGVVRLMRQQPGDVC